jgi:hypothetical protein
MTVPSSSHGSTQLRLPEHPFVDLPPRQPGALSPATGSGPNGGARDVAAEGDSRERGPCRAPGAANYLRDCIELFEEYGWDWTYHAYREWDGWSVEHGSDPNDHQPTAEPTDRKQLLLSWFAKNEKPRM